MNIATEQHHFHLETDNDDIVWLHMDKTDAGTNVLGSEVLRELDRHLEAIASRAPRGLVILSDKANGFIAGADIHEFTRIRNEAEALELVRLGQSVFNRLDALGFPTVALIHGFCLGGGLELALACRYRVALDSPGTRLGLPEVRLGIHPGFGGSVRLHTPGGRPESHGPDAERPQHRCPPGQAHRPGGSCGTATPPAGCRPQAGARRPAAREARLA